MDGHCQAIAGSIVCADLFDSGETLEKLWNRLVSSYVMDVMDAGWRRRVRASGAAGTSAFPSGELGGERKSRNGALSTTAVLSSHLDSLDDLENHRHGQP
jgi:hypothetical protein